MSNTSEATLSIILKVRDQAAKAVDRIHVSMKRLHGTVGALGGKLMWLGKIGIIGAITAITAVAGAIVTATKAAGGEQAGLARLDASLKANVKNRKGAAAAIDAQMKKGMGLAFSDEQVRDSMARLLPVTKSVSGAIKAQNVAMDVSRLTGKDLGASSDLVAKAMMGNQKALKALGITLPKGAKGYEVLAAIQKKVAGQADAFAKTAPGAWDAFRVSLDNLLQDVGKDFLPVVAQVFTFLREKGLPVVREIIQGVKDWVSANRPMIDQIASFVSGALSTLVTFVTGTVIPALVGRGGKDSGLVGAAVKIGTEIATNVVPKVQGFVQTLVSDVIPSIAKVVGPILDNLLPAFGKIAEALFGGAGGKGDGRGGRTKGSSGLIGAIGNLVGALWGDGDGALAGVLKVVAAVFTDVIVPAIVTTFGWIEKLIGAVTTLVDWLNQLKKLMPTGSITGGAGTAGGGAGKAGSVGRNMGQISGIPGRASGGWAGLHGPELSWLGERGPEYVIPNHQLRGGAGAGFRIVGVSERELLDIVERGLYVRLQRSSLGR